MERKWRKETVENIGKTGDVPRKVKLIKPPLKRNLALSSM